MRAWKEDITHITTVHVTLFLFTRTKAGHKYVCVHVWARRRCYVVILSMVVVVAFAASVESSLLSSSLLEPRRDRGN